MRRRVTRRNSAGGLRTEIPDWLDAGDIPRQRGPHRLDASEFSHGACLTPPGLEDASESDGGRYHGRTPPIRPDIRMSEGQMDRRRAPRRWPEG